MYACYTLIRMIVPASVMLFGYRQCLYIPGYSVAEEAKFCTRMPKLWHCKLQPVKTNTHMYTYAHTHTHTNTQTYTHSSVGKSKLNSLMWNPLSRSLLHKHTQMVGGKYYFILSIFKSGDDRKRVGQRHTFSHCGFGLRCDVCVWG